MATEFGKILDISLTLSGVDKEVKNLGPKILAIMALLAAGTCFIISLYVADSDMPTGNAVILIMLLGMAAILFAFIGILIFKDY